tara:strand:- start:380 stop:682 length:303 start_codon:yes stop_codon:yes gene_type:complete
VSKFTNVVRFSVKKGSEKLFETQINNMNRWDGLLIHVVAKTGTSSYVSYGLWESEQSMSLARPKMIALLDSCREFLEEISPELGVTDPVSGPVISEYIDI